MRTVYSCLASTIFLLSVVLLGFGKSSDGMHTALFAVFLQLCAIEECVKEKNR